MIRFEDPITRWVGMFDSSMTRATPYFRNFSHVAAKGRNITLGCGVKLDSTKQKTMQGVLNSRKMHVTKPIVPFE